MAFYNNVIAGAAGSGGDAGYKIERSLRFNSDDSASLSKSVPNITTFTFSFWYKHVKASRSDIFVTDAGTGFFFYQHSDGSFRVNSNSGALFTSNGLYRDPSAWYHIVITNDGTTFKLYVNGVLDKSSTISTGLTSGGIYIGKDRASANTYGNFYLADAHFLDGIAVSNPDGVFGEFDADTGVWNPIEFAGTTQIELPATVTPTLSNGALIVKGVGGNSVSGTVTSGGGNLNFFESSNGTNWTHVGSGTSKTYSNVNWIAAGGAGYSPRSFTTSGADFQFAAWNTNTNFDQGGGTTTDVTGLTFSDPSTSAFGANGFHLDFSDNSSSAALGNDASGNNNNFTVNNLSVSSILASGNGYNGSLNQYMPSGVAQATDPSQLASTSNRTHFFLVDQNNNSNITVVATATSMTVGSTVYDGWGNNNPTTTLNNGTVTPNSSGTDSSVSGKNLATNTFTGLTVGNTYTISTKNGGAGNPHRVHYVTGATVQNTPIVDTDSLLDSPNDNFCTLNPLDKEDKITLSNGNLKAVGTNNQYGYCRGTLAASSGKYYFEVAFNGNQAIGTGWTDANGELRTAGANNDTLLGQDYWNAVYAYNGIFVFIKSNQVYTQAGNASDGDVFGCAVDMDTKYVWFSYNGTWLGTGTQDPSTGQGGWYVDNLKNATPFFSDGAGSQVPEGTFNFGQIPWAYTPPTNFLSLSTASLPEPDIANGSTQFKAVLRNGFGTGGGGGTVTTGFKPGLLWEKTRSTSGNHFLYDTVRGVGKILFPNTANPETNDTNLDQVSAFTSTGYTLGNNEWGTNVTLVGWAWKEGSNFASSSYNQSEVWSSKLSTYLNSFGSEPVTNLFDGDTSTNFYSSNTSGSGIKFVPATAITGSIELYLRNGDTANSTFSYSLDNGSTFTNLTTTGGNGSYVSIGNQTISNTNGIIVRHVTTAGSNSVNWRAIKVDNKVLVDAGLVPVGSQNSTVYNTSQNWSVSGSNMQNNWSASFDGNMSNFALPNTGYSASMTFSSAISYSTLELVMARDLHGPDLLMNGNALNVPITNTNNTGGVYQIERMQFTNGTLTSIGHNTRNIAGQGGSGFYQIIVDGKILVDSTASPQNVPSLATKCHINADAGMSIVTYQANLTVNDTIYHGLGVKPHFAIFKNRDNTGGNGQVDWGVYHHDLGATKVMELNQTFGQQTYGGPFNNIEPDAYKFTLGTGGHSYLTNGPAGDDFMGYIFREVPGFSKFSVYTGSGSAQFIPCGFRPAWVMIKRYTDNTVGEWGIYDNTRAPYNEIQKKVWANNNSGEEDHPNNSIDFVSNGFVVDPGSNAPNVQYTNNVNVGYLFAAFAESPLKYARAR